MAVIGIEGYCLFGDGVIGDVVVGPRAVEGAGVAVVGLDGASFVRT